MILSDDRIGVLAHQITTSLAAKGLIAMSLPEVVTQEVRRALARFCQVEEGLEQRVRAKIGSLKRGVAEGSREWEILYQKYYEEELNKINM